MPITINGSTGISGVDGSAGTPAVIGSDADTGLVFSAGRVQASLNAAGYVHNGLVTIANVSGNIWVLAGTIHNATYAEMPSGTKTLSDVFTQLRVTTVNGTDTFDAGSINILYE